MALRPRAGGASAGRTGSAMTRASADGFDAVWKRNGQVPTMFTAPELMAETLPAVKWIVPDILPEGVTILGGKPKMGKSWMALGLAVAVATGGVALGTKRVEQGDALY